jgi:hypothetical protein
MAAPATNLVPIDVGREPRTRVLSWDTTLEPRKGKVESSATSVADLRLFREVHIDHNQPVRLSQNDLYPARQAFSPEHITALRLLKLAIGRCKHALDALADDPMTADIAIQKIQMSLPELFCCRVLGDGFGTIVNALICALQNTDGNTLDQNQIRTLERVFKELRDKPFLSAPDSDDAVELLESNGFNPYPKELIEFLSSDQSIRHNVLGGERLRVEPVR